ncbi:MAG: alginate export family protein [Phycisphaeraceae bacterium]
MITACVVVLGAMLLVNPAAGQTQIDRFERQLEQVRRETRMLVHPDVPVEQRALVDFGAYASFYFLAMDDIQGSTHILRQTELNPYARVNFDGAHEFFFRGRVGYRDWNSGDAFDGRGDRTLGPHLERAYYRFDLRRAMAAYEGENIDFNLTIQGGRQLVHWANGLVLSTELDGGIVGGELGSLTIQAIGGRSRKRQTDIDSARPRFDRNMQRDFFGGIVTYELSANHRPFVYGLVQRDENDDESINFLGSDTRFDYNSHYIGVGSEGNLTDKLLYGVEAVYQGGDTLSFAPFGTQTREDIRAWALSARGDYLVTDANNTRFTAEFVAASGDDDRVFHTTNTFGGVQPGHTDNAFNAFGLVNTGYAFNTNASNLLMLRLGASTYPFAETQGIFQRLQLGADFFVFNKMDADGPIDEPTDDSRYLGLETDFYANWQVTSDLAVTTRYGVFFPGGAIAAGSNPRHFLFTGVTLGF